jgi:hypothetical protein
MSVPEETRLERGELSGRIYAVIDGQHHDITEAFLDLVWADYDQIPEIWDLLRELAEE